MSTTQPFDAYSRYYDLLYQDKNYQAEATYIDQLLQHHGIGGNKLLEFGCGTGKHAQLLLERGYQVTGVELSASMLEKAIEMPGLRYLQGDIRHVHVPETFDAVISLFHVVSYQVSNQDVLAVFARAAEHLQTGGLFVFDTWYTPAVLKERPSVRVKRIQDNDIFVTRIAEPVLYPNANRVDVNYSIFIKRLADGQISQLTETHPMRHFSLPELDLLAEASGFVRVAAEEFLTAQSPSEASWGVCVVLKKVV